MRAICSIYAFLFVFLVSCSSKKIECTDPCKDKFSYNYNVQYELQRYVSSDGKNRIQSGPIKLDLISNSEKVVKITFDDSTFIGVEVAVFPLIFRKDTTLVFDILYYDISLDNKWIPMRKEFTPNDLNFDYKLISYSDYIVSDSDSDSDEDDPNNYKLIHAVTFKKNKKK